jgi:glycerol-3-phosphate dehydrogenase
LNRTASIAKLKSVTFDLCIIGAGASGAGCALDAALRGLNVALIEKEDFAASTSSKSTKLIHGGVRYLEQAFKKMDFGQLKQVRHGLEERYNVIKNAPFLAKPLALLTPCYSWFEGLYFTIGLRIYDAIAGKKDPLPKSRWLSKKSVLKRAKNINPKLHSAVLYYDGHFDDARYCLLLAKTAAEKGATVANHVQAEAFQHDSAGRLQSVVVTDATSGEKFEIRARVFLNCAGPAADHLRLMANADLEPRIRPSKGVHAVLPLEVMGSAETALLIPKTTDDRVIFALPWEGKLLVGTTDTPYDSTEEPELESDETDFLLENLNRYLATPVGRDKVLAGFGGLRPLVASDPTRSTKSLLRDHEVEQDEKSGLLSLLGGKWTTYRVMAQDAIDEVCRHLAIATPCKTQDQPLAGTEGYNPNLSQELTQAQSLPQDVAQHLVAKYGSRARAVIALLQEDQGWRERLHPAYPFIAAEVVYAVREEMALSLRDMLARRWRLEMMDWQAVQDLIPKVAELMAGALGWSEAQKATAISEYRQKIAGFRGKAG